MIHISLPPAAMGELEQQYEACCPLYEEILEKFVRFLRELLSEKNLSVTVRHRVKRFSSWYKKLLKRIPPETSGKSHVQITDILGVRIVCPFLEDVDRISRILQETCHVQELEIKGSDYPSSHFGYESVHFLIKVPAKFIPSDPFPAGFPRSPVCEIQIRTILQDAWAEVEHELIYKSDFSPLDVPLKRKLAALNANLTLSDIMFQEIRDYQRELHAALKQRRKDFYDRIRLSDSPEDADYPGEKRISDLHPVPSQNTVDSLLLQGLLAHTAGKYSEAVDIYSKILSRDLDGGIRSIILVHRGMAYFSSGLTREASADFDTALQLDPGHTKARYYRAVQSRMDRHFEEAYADLNACINADPYNLEYLTARAETSMAAGDPASAAADCDTVLRIDPAFKPALRIRKMLEG